MRFAGSLVACLLLSSTAAGQFLPYAAPWDEKLLLDPRLDAARLKPLPEEGALLALAASVFAKDDPMFLAQLQQYQEEEQRRAKKEPLYTAKVLAARQVAVDFVREQLRTRKLPRPRCIPPEDWGVEERWREAVQQEILKRKFGIDWWPPPQPAPRLIAFRAAADGPLPPVKLLGHKAIITGIAAFADGKRVATAADDGVIVWDAASGKILRRHDAPKAFAVAVSPDERWLAAGGLSREILVWEAATGKEHARLALEGSVAGDIFEVTFSPDSKHLAAVVRGTVVVVEAAAGKIVHRLELRSRPLHAALFSRDGKTLTCAADLERTFALKRLDPSVAQWSLETGKLLREFHYAVSSEDRIFLSADGRDLIFKAGFLRFVDVQTGKEVRSVERHLRIFAMSPDGMRFFGSEGDVGGIYETATGKRVARLPVWGFPGAFVASGRGLVVARGTEAIVWEIHGLP